MSITSDVGVVPPPEALQEFPCANCGRKTRHKILTAVDWHDGDDNVDVWHSYWTVQCLGCNTVSFCLETRFSEDIDFNEHGQFIVPKLYQFPHRLPGRSPLEYGEVPDNIHAMYLEAYEAIAHESPILAGIGLRAVLEMVCKQQARRSTSCTRSSKACTSAGSSTLLT
jgi:hypothetical protein